MVKMVAAAAAAHNTAKEIIQATKNVRKKYKLLKWGRTRVNEHMKEILKPVLDPLQEISKNTLPPPPSAPLVPPKEEYKPKFPFVNKRRLKFESTRNETADDDNDDGDDDGFTEEEEEEEEHTKSFDANASLREYFDQYPPISRQFVSLLLSKNDYVDQTMYGPRLDRATEKLSLGSEVMRIAGVGDITIKNRVFPGTEGLYSLIFLKNPQTFTKNDMDQYREILHLTNVYRTHYDPNEPIRGNRSRKYMEIIRPLIKPSTSGGDESYRGGKMSYLHFNTKPIEYKYFDNLDELVARLALLHASTQAGNNNHTNEIAAITEELRELDVIY